MCAACVEHDTLMVSSTVPSGMVTMRVTVVPGSSGSTPIDRGESCEAQGQLIATGADITEREATIRVGHRAGFETERRFREFSL